MTDFITGLERDLVAAAARRAATNGPAHAPGTTGAPAGDGRRRSFGLPLRTVLVALVIGGTTASAGAAATLVALRGSVIPAPSAADVPREQTPVPDSVRVSAVRAPDPAPGVPPWTVRVARSTTGYVCSTIGQVSGGVFGLVGLDGRFRPLAPGVTNSCGQEQRDAASLIGARTLAARRDADARVVVSGVAGDRLRRVVVSTSQGRRTVPHDAGGAFVTVYRGHPEDLGAEATLTFDGGRIQRVPLGRDPAVLLDPLGGPAWRAQAGSTDDDERNCVSFGTVRRVPGGPQSPPACGLLGPAGDPTAPSTGVFFAVRRLSAITVRRSPERRRFTGDWRGDPPRTAVWGGMGRDVRSVAVLGVPGRSAPVQIVRPRSGSAFLGVFPPTVRPSSLRVRVTLRDGTVRTYRGDTNLVDHRVPVRRTTTPGGRP
ncbi:hypothetical protein [Patulibacter minatonensis]|uniref:hypothetical protein n=1 Tax=Patulibacter minatonensis TaxID=298163 RepID=UPI00047B7D29|nr:hypothetical protein [Patulibacter minatonensis]